MQSDAHHSHSDLISNVGANLRIECALLDALGALEPIRAVSFKGPLLTRLLEGNLGGRVSSDNDLLVHPSDWTHAIQRLLERGYTPYIVRADGGSFAQPDSAQIGAFSALDELEFRPPVGSVQVILDLHKVAFSSLHFAADERVVWQNLRHQKLHGREVLTFSNELTLVHLAGHSVSHWLDPRTLGDVRSAWSELQSSLDLDLVEKLARETITVETLAVVLLVACRSPKPVLRACDNPTLLRKADAFVALGSTQNQAFRAALVTLLALPRSRQLAVFRRIFLPQRTELRQRFGSGSFGRLWLQHWARALSKLHERS
jgi:Uncharacterised nucleotidyltransferase